MYLFENTRDYVKQNELQIGDNIILYKDEGNELYISYKKASVSISAPTNNEGGSSEVERSLQGKPSEDSFSEFGHSSSNMVDEEDTWYEQAGILLDEPTCANDIMIDESQQLEDSYCMDAHKGYDFRDFEQLADFKDCDFSLYNKDDDLMQLNLDDDQNNKDKGGGSSSNDN
ncbi:hypothetical protein AQUCO_03600107v1 [Aquilegia coerulea]|uniref:TF-B3 domain-containing protein n=1 Tax=Aquilegia coerulea TaxID=218851 RepID=A0A2G5CVA1_AQUCA|nr:hypothetical protein AQUCO_03600107v1 [Aquilegia coerulea]